MPRLTLNNDVDRKETLAEDITEADFNSYISAANSRLSPFDLEIRSTFHQTSRQRIYALINSTSDPIMQLATVHTADEISFLKRLLDAMFETYNTIRQEVCAITSMQAMKLAKPPAEDRRETQNGSTTQGSSGQGLTLLQAEKMLQSLVDEGWLEKSRKGFYSLSPRALMELRGWLLETYNSVDSEDEDGAENPINKVKVCVACKEILTSVSMSPSGECCECSFSFRVRDVQGKPVHVGSMTSVPRTSSACRSQASARCVRKSGRATFTWGSAQWILQIRGGKRNGKVERRREDNHLSMSKIQIKMDGVKSHQIENRREIRGKRRKKTKKTKHEVVRRIRPCSTCLDGTRQRELLTLSLRSSSRSRDLSCIFINKIDDPRAQQHALETTTATLVGK